MVSDQYHVNLAMSQSTTNNVHNDHDGEDVTTKADKTVGKVRDLKGSISGPIPGDQDVPTSVLEYFGIAASEKMDHQYTMQAHNRLNEVLKSTGGGGGVGANPEESADRANILYRVPERVHQDHHHPKRTSTDRSSTASSFSAWRSSNCRNPIYSSRIDDMWSRLEYWWNILKWPLVLLLICSILGLFIYFLVVEMEINESLLNTDKVIESNIFLREMNYQEIPHNASWLANDSSSSANGSGGTTRNNDSGTSINTDSVQRPYPTLPPAVTGSKKPGDNGKEKNRSATSSSSSPTFTYSGFSGGISTSTTDPSQKQFGFTSGHQNSFGVPIEEDERVLKRLNDELIKFHNGTTTPRMSTTTNEYRTKVSPTLPLIRKTPESTTERLNNLTRLDNDKCVSTSLPLCRGVLHYDLTAQSSQGMSAEETVLFKYLIDSRCSSRASQFMCSLFEPECRPVAMSDTLPPCKRFCKSILEPCSQVVANSELLTELFDCDIYPESHDPKVCNDPTRFSKCLKNEFKCTDSTCIPQQWRCDNIKDCASGDDEEDCKFCDQDEFKCTENDKCIPDDWRCDQYKDCPNGSDELDCIDDDSRSFPLGYGTPARVYPFAQEVAPNAPNRLPYQTLNEEVRQQRVADDQEHATSNVAGRTILVSKSLANFQDSTEIMMTSDSENKFKYSQGGDVEGLQTAHISPCPEGELRCLSGRCISLTQLCDSVVDCADGSDEAMCDETRTNASVDQSPRPSVA